MNHVYHALAATILLFASGAGGAADTAKAEALLKQHACVSCHAVDKKLIGPAYREVAKKYKGQKDAAARLTKSVKAGSKGVWGPVPMPPNAAPSDADVKAMVEYVLAL